MNATTLRSALSHADAAERRRLLAGLAEFTDPETATIVAHHLGDPSPAVCEAAVAALGREASLAGATAAAARLASPQAAERQFALEALVRIGAPALPALNALMQSPDRDLRRYGAEALAALRDPAALPALALALRDPDVSVVATAAEGLGSLCSPGAVPALRAVLGGPDWVKVAALHSLAAIGGDEALEAIASVRPEESAHVLAAAAEAIVRIEARDPRRAGDFLAALLTHPDPLVRDVGLEGLAALLARPGPDLVENGRQGRFPEWAASIEAASAMLPALRSPRPRTRAAAVTWLACLPQAGAAPLQAAMDDPAHEVREAAWRAAWNVGTVGALQLAELAAEDSQRLSLRLLGLRLLGRGRAGPAAQRPSDAAAVTAKLESLARETPEAALRAACACALLRHDAAAGCAACLELLADPELAGGEEAMAEFSACPVAVLAPLVEAARRAPDAAAVLETLFACLPPESATRLAPARRGEPGALSS